MCTDKHKCFWTAATNFLLLLLISCANQVLPESCLGKHTRQLVNFLVKSYWQKNETNYIIKRYVQFNTYHDVGTCRMGPPSDPMAVVDPELRVYGVAGLRVADAAIMPEISSGNTAVPIMMIGERCADMIKRTYGLAEYRSYG